mmetsp:Transcript_4597/g.12221  ORF Transcript_4597/g.12221 Transcript_4597/m.12221 type:complete len:238 (+) Transcript_4597:952-1665(+)
MKVAGARSVRLNLERASGMGERLRHLACHLHIRQLIWVGTLRRRYLPSTDPTGEQQGACKLRAIGDAHNHWARLWAPAMNHSREFIIGGVDPIAELAKCSNELLLWTFVHPRDTAQAHDASAQADHRRQEACSSAGIGYKELQRLLFCASLRKLSAAAMDRDDPIGCHLGIGVDLDFDTQLMHAVRHGFSVLTPQCTLEGHNAITQRSKHNGTVSDRFRARYDDLRFARLKRLELLR